MLLGAGLCGAVAVANLITGVLSEIYFGMLLNRNINW